jgi:DNA-binding transcriptional LysR family regulator
MDLDLRLVRYFVAVADELHFGRAAARLYVSQPALSRQIRKLEDQVGELLLVRDSRHVTLTARGERFQEDARQLLAIADRLQRPIRTDGIRVAHIHELATSRDVCDAYASAFPGVPLIEHAMDSNAQLDAILENRLDVAILRVTSSMVADHPRGWNHRLLRMEPMVVVGGFDDSRTSTVSLVDQPFEVFGDPVESGTYNAHGTYLTALEQDLNMTIKWLGTPGAFSHCLAHVRRADSQVGRLEFLSYGERYAAVGLPFRLPRECQPYYPWSLAWRDDDTTDATADFLRVALRLSGDRGWLELSDHAPAWLPPDEPVREEALARPARRRHTGVSDRNRARSR